MLLTETPSIFTGADDPDTLVFPLPQDVRGYSVKVKVKTGMGLRDGSGKYNPLEIPLADREESAAVVTDTVTVVVSLDLDYSSAEVDNTTMQPPIEDGTCTDIDIVPRIDTAVPSAPIKLGNPPIDDTDGTIIMITGVDNLNALLFPLSEEF